MLDAQSIKLRNFRGVYFHTKELKMFRHLKLEIASAIPALNERKIKTISQAVPGNNISQSPPPPSGDS